MIILIFCVLVFLSFLVPKSKGMLYTLSGFLWIVISTCLDCADREVYFDRYNLYLSSGISSFTEIGYTSVMSFFHWMGLTYTQFLFVINAIMIIVFIWFVVRNSKRPALAMALYSIAIFAIDFVQIRNTLGFCLVLIGIDTLMNDACKTKKSIIIYCILVIMASTIHFANLLFLLLLIPYLYGTKVTVIFTLVANIIWTIFGQITLISNIVSRFVGVTRTTSILERILKYSSIDVFRIQLATIATSIILLLVIYLQVTGHKKKLVKTNMDRASYSIQYLENVSFGANTIILSLSVLSLVSLVLDVYRIPRYLIILGLTCITNYPLNNKHHKKMSQNYKLLLLAATLALFWIQFIFLKNYEVTFRPIFFRWFF